MNKTILVFLLLPVFSFSQFHLANTGNAVSNVLTKVIEDYPDHFNQIRGDVVDRDVQSVIYTSNVNIQDADTGFIIQNGNDADNIFSWKQIVFNTEDFDVAKQKFHEYYSRIKGTSVTADGKAVNFRADYTAPDDSKHFTTILFTPTHTTETLKNVVIDLSMQYMLNGWQISVSVYEHTNYGVDDIAN